MKRAILWSFLWTVSIIMNSGQTQELVSKNRSPHLDRYKTFSDAVVMHFRIPDDTVFASFSFVAGEKDMSIFGCNVRDVSLYLKYGAPPVINPDGSLFPEEFKNLSRAQVYNLEFLSNEQEIFINISSPEPGNYYVATFLAYEDPRYQKISQEGLTQSCEAYVDGLLYVTQIENPIVITDQQTVKVIGRMGSSTHFKFIAPSNAVDHAILNIETLNLPATVSAVMVRVAARRPPSETVHLLQQHLNATGQLVFELESDHWHYVSFEFPASASENDTCELTFVLKLVADLPQSAASKQYESQSVGNLTVYNMSVEHKIHRSYHLTDAQPYKQYVLLRESAAESFTYSYKLQPEIGSVVFLPINVTGGSFGVLRFIIGNSADIGGTLQYILAFKPRVRRQNGAVSFQPEPENHTILGCIQRNSVAVPTWPNRCVSSDDFSMLAPLVLNRTVTNATVLIPYPESGVWYASFKLFCDGSRSECEPCTCLETCQDKYGRCVLDCESVCYNVSKEEVADCGHCVGECRAKVLSVDDECGSCADCDGGCSRKSSNSDVCESAVIFDVSSKPCYYGECGKQGRCGMFISEGVAYSSCLCSNNYRGYDCSDGSLATPYYLVVIEFLLLVLSNVFFLPATYIGLKRQYYVEALSYFSIFLASSFYHACDAGENILSFCVFRLSALQFADFFSALLAIWLTLLAIGDLSPVHLSLLQMGGAIVIAFCVTLNRYAFWIFALPTGVGITIIATSWYVKYRKYRSRFIAKTYVYVKLPVGVTVVAIGLIIYGLLQTQNNYKYLHSLWHVIMATGVFFLLPEKDTFQAAALLT